MERNEFFNRSAVEPISRSPESRAHGYVRFVRELSMKKRVHFPFHVHFITLLPRVKGYVYFMGSCTEVIIELFFRSSHARRFNEFGSMFESMSSGIQHINASIEKKGIKKQRDSQ